MNPEFRPYRSDDREACRRIMCSQVGTYLAPGEEQDFENFLNEIEANPDKTFFWVASLDAKPIGCCGVEVQGEYALLCWGILSAGQLSKGLGKAMLLHRLDWLHANRPGVKSVLCHTAPLTEGFFAKHGFSTYQRESNYWGGKLELVAMELSFDGVMRGVAIRNEDSGE